MFHDAVFQSGLMEVNSLRVHHQEACPVAYMPARSCKILEVLSDFIPPKSALVSVVKGPPRVTRPANVLVSARKSCKHDLGGGPVRKHPFATSIRERAE